jgi:uncharacterized protein with PIN domain
VIFLVDAQLPPALARWLTQQGHVAQHVYDLGLRNAEDLTIWNHASNRGAIIITKDEDFAERNNPRHISASNRLASHRQRHQSGAHAMADAAMGRDHNSSRRRQQAYRSALIPTSRLLSL